MIKKLETLESKIGHNQYIFLRDICNGVTYFSDSEKERKIVLCNVSTSLTPAEEKEMLTIISKAIRDKNDIKWALTEFFQDVIHLIIYGKAEYGLFIESDILNDVPFRLIKKEYWPLMNRKPDCVIKFRFPESFGGNRKIKKIFKKLSDTEHSYMELYKEGVPFDPIKKNSFLYRSKLTSILAWAQQNESEYFTEYYFMYRIIKFREFITILRESLLDQLNNVLNCDLVKLDVKLGLEGVLRSEEFPDIYEQFRHQDSCDFKKFLDMILTQT